MRKLQSARVVIADDHPLVQMGVRFIVRELLPEARIRTCDNAMELLAVLQEQHGAELVVMDISMPHMSGVAALRQLRGEFPRLRVLVYSGHVDPGLIRSCFDLGALGYLPKTASNDEIRHALQLVLAGRVYLPRLVFDRTALPEAGAPLDDEDWCESPSSATDPHAGMEELTPRQREVFRLMEQGMSNKEIARLLDCAENTVKNHVSAILRSFGVGSRIKAIEAVRRMRSGLPLGKL